MVLSSFILVIGGEAFGPSKEVLELADEVLSIPMQRGVESLNARAWQREYSCTNS